MICGLVLPIGVYPIKVAIFGLCGHTRMKLSRASGCVQKQYPLGLPLLFPLQMARPVMRIWRHSLQIGTLFFPMFLTSFLQLMDGYGACSLNFLAGQPLDTVLAIDHTKP